MALTHIVLFQFKPEATSEQVRDVGGALPLSAPRKVAVLMMGA